MQTVTAPVPTQNFHGASVLVINTASNTSLTTPERNIDAASSLATLDTNATPVSQIPLEQIPATTSVTTKATKAAMHIESSVEAQVKSYFSDVPTLIYIAQCESNFTQFNSDGSVFRGVINPADVGVMQINQYYNGESAQRLDYDIKSLEGNMAFARYLYNTYGTKPWSASQKCWAPKIVSASNTQNELAEN
jgi:hypothetical protein